MLKVVVNKRASILTLLGYFESKNANYVWIHDQDSISIGDIDLAVTRELFNQIDQLILSFASDNSFKVIQVLQHEYCAKYFVLIRLIEEEVEYLIPDICSDYVRDGRIFIKAEEFINQRIYKDGYYKCTPSIEAEYIFIKHVMKNKWSAKQLDNFKKSYKNDFKKASIRLSSYLSRNMQESIINIAQNEDIQQINKISLNLKKAVLLNTLLNNKYDIIIYRYKEILRVFRRIIRPTGLVIVIIGTDGSGKSTIIEQLSTVLGPSFRKITKYHWLPVKLRKNDANTIVVNPHEQPPRNILLSMIKLVVYCLEYCVIDKLFVYPQKIKSTLVLYDRYYYDIIVDPKRFRMKMPPIILKMLLSIIPKPDLVFYINTEPSIAYSRKKELQINELERQNGEYIKIKKRLNEKFHIINNNGCINSAINDIACKIYTHLENRIVQ